MSELYNGFQDLMEDLEKIISKVEKPEKILEIGAKEFTQDLKKLPKPISQIKKSGYTHLIRTFAYRQKGKEFEIGWGKYYGPMVENGTEKMNARTHLKPCWEKNKEKYYKKMIKETFN